MTVERGAGRTAPAPRFAVLARLDTAVEINYYRNGGILQTVLRKLVGWLTGPRGGAGSPSSAPRTR